MKTRPDLRSEETTSLYDALVRIIAEGLPLVQRPYAEIARRLQTTEVEVISTIKRIHADGNLKRFGIVVRHRKLGYRANGMVVWDLPDDRVTEIGEHIGSYSFVTLCYQRPRRLPDWPYNLFSMIHGRNHDAVAAQVDYIAEECGLQDYARDILFSKRCFKQRGASYSGSSTVQTRRPFANE